MFKDTERLVGPCLQESNIARAFLFVCFLFLYQCVYTSILFCNLFLCKLCISLYQIFSTVNRKLYIESSHRVFTARYLALSGGL